MVVLSPEAIDLPMDSRHGKSQSSLPQWLHHDVKVMLFHKNNYLKGWLTYDDDSGWEFQIRKRNGEVRWKNKLPNLLSQHSNLIDNKHILLGWSNSVRQIIATTRHVSTKNLSTSKAPRALRLALLGSNVDRLIWLASYIEEIQGLLRMETFETVTKTEDKALRKKHGVKAIPSMCVLTEKFDGLGNPLRAKSRVVALGNFEKENYTKGDCYAPVASHYAIRLIVCIALEHNEPLKQGDCKNVFVQSYLTELIIVKPPPYYPFSDHNSYWLLRKSLYGLRRAPRYWFDRISTVLKLLNLQPCPNESCYFVGKPLENEPPLHLVIYVDDFVYFSSSDKVGKHFEEKLKEHVIVYFIGIVDYFLGLRFAWDISDKTNFKLKLVQEGYIKTMMHKMGMPKASSVPTMAPYRSGYPIDAVPPDNTLPHEEQTEFTSTYRSHVGMLSWLAQSTRPGIVTVVSLLSTYQSKPTKAHIESAKYAAKYLHSTFEKCINFSHKK